MVYDRMGFYRRASPDKHETSSILIRRPEWIALTLHCVPGACPGLDPGFAGKTILVDVFGKHRLLRNLRKNMEASFLLHQKIRHVRSSEFAKMG